MIMIKRILIFAVLFTICGQLFSQKYFTRDGRIVFESNAPIENIVAVNKKAMCVWDTESGAIELAVLIKSFKFEKALMEEHFNENYLESEEFPKAKFKGQVVNMSSIDLGKNGAYVAELEGDLSMHGVAKAVQLNANISVDNRDVKGIATFDIVVADYNIKIPQIVVDKIAKTVQIVVDLDLKLLDE